MNKITKKLLTIGISVFILTLISPTSVSALACRWETYAGGSQYDSMPDCKDGYEGALMADCEGIPTPSGYRQCCCKDIEEIKGETYYQVDPPKLIVQIPGFGEFTKAECTTDKQGVQSCESSWIGEYISAIYRYAIGIVGILAVAVLMLGGLIWLLSGGSPEKVTSAKSWITAGITGLILALSSYIILNTINPNLVKFGTIKTQTSFQESDWLFDVGIKSQLGDASNELNALLNCMRAELDAGVGRISSISDSAGLEKCRDDYDPEICAHSNKSCHYGGYTGSKSYAVDFGDEENMASLIKAAEKCGGRTNPEPTHLHVSVDPCSGL